ncbi:MAG: nicotinamidase [Thiobacillus sp.]
MTAQAAPRSAALHLQQGDLLLVTDVQNDFLPGGSLAVPDGAAVVPVLNRYIDAFVAAGLPVYATRDWHPPRHCSFREQGGPWPVHCVVDTPGAAFAPGLALPPSVPIISKATEAGREAYSSFEGTPLDSRLRRAGIRRLFIGGLATDYCILNSVRDALRLGYEVFVLTDAVRAVNVDPGDGERALAEMTRLGAQCITFEELAA